MTELITVLAPIKLIEGKTEADLLAASDRFQTEFINDEPGVLRRELVRHDDGSYLDIVQFRSSKDMEDVMVKEQESEACRAFFAVMDVENEADIKIYTSLETYS
ncbi:MAG: hypothetical protein HRU22_04265 [Gammaproteobacteria bacterium]|nr:hypothetical protein [Gammaproteobacteria bacterium]